MEMVNEILQWIAIIWAGWAINKLATAIEIYEEALKDTCKLIAHKWEYERRKRENQ